MILCVPVCTCTCMCFKAWSFLLLFVQDREYSSFVLVAVQVKSHCQKFVFSAFCFYVLNFKASWVQIVKCSPVSSNFFCDNVLKYPRHKWGTLCFTSDAILSCYNLHSSVDFLQRLHWFAATKNLLSVNHYSMPEIDIARISWHCK